MQAIKTSFHGPTEHRPTRIVGKCQAGMVIVSYDDEFSIEENHRKACHKLLEKMGWKGRYYGGSYKGDFYWVSDDPFLSPLANNGS